MFKYINHSRTVWHVKVVYVDEDYGPVTKILGALLQEDDKNTVIITVDDDVIYPETLVEELLYHHYKFPNTALSSSGLSIGSYPFAYSVALCSAARPRPIKPAAINIRSGLMPCSK